MIQVVFSNKDSNINRESVSFFKKVIPTTAKLKILFEFIVAEPKDAAKCKEQGVVNFPTLIHRDKKITGLLEIKKYVTNIVNVTTERTNNTSEEDILKEYWKTAIGGLVIGKDGKFELPDDDEEDIAGDNKISSEAKDKLQKEMVRRKIQTAGSDKKSPPNNLDKRHSPHETVEKMSVPPLTKQTQAPHRTSRVPVAINAPTRRKDNLDNNKNPNTVDVLSSLKGGGEEASDDQLMAKMFANMEETVVQ